MKKGDIIYCVDTNSTKLKKNTPYKITGVIKGGDKIFFKLDTDEFGTYYMNRFISAKEMRKNKVSKLLS